MSGRPPPNAFVAALADALPRLALEEKTAILLAPSNRIGTTWLDRAAVEAGVVANVRIMTPPRLLAELARPALERSGLEPAAEIDRLAAVAAALAARRTAGGKGYFSGLTPSASLLRMLDRTFRDLAEAGITGSEALVRALSPPERGRELALLHADYRARLAENGSATPDLTIRLALESPVLGDSNPPFLIFPRDLAEHFPPGVPAVVAAWPAARVRPLPVDEGEPTAELDFFAADGEVNEAREAFRRILESGVPLDGVEIALAGGRSGLVAFCEAALEVFAGRDRPAPMENLPLTFEEGLPGSFARPARLLSAWLDWLRGEADAAGLGGLFASGLIADDRGGGDAAPADRVADALRAFPPRRGVKALAAGIAKFAAREDTPAARALRRFADGPLGPLSRGSGADRILLSARTLLSDWAAVGGELDAYALKSLLEDPFVSGGAVPWPEFDAFQWLADLADGLRLLGQGPRPGKAHVSGLDGGHAGRPVLFVMGLGDAVVPGGDRQDPALLDAERARISPALPLASERGGRNEAKLRRLLARARGRAVLSHSRLDISQDRETYAADAFHEYARHSGKVAQAAAFLPGSAEKRASAGEFWFDALAAKPPAFPSPEAERLLFPGLAAGEKAALARSSAAFTEYDGFVPDAAGVPESLSPTQLEALLANPQEYFFRWTLGIAPPERSEPAPGRWLSAADRGTLMHEVFHDFQQALLERGERADGDRHAGLLEQTLEARLRHWRGVRPPENAALFELERRDLVECMRVYLHSEAEHQRTARPAHLEAAFGMEGRTAPWNGGEPATLALPSGRAVRLRGRLDRVDVSDSGGLVIWDYKTGSPAGFSATDPFKDGKLQAALYAMALESFFAGKEGFVSASGYFFPSPESGGRRFLYAAPALSRVLEIVDALAGLLEAGAFPHGLKARGSYDYAPIFDAVGGADRLAEQAAAKAAAGAAALSGWRDLF